LQTLFYVKIQDPELKSAEFGMKSSRIRNAEVERLSSPRSAKLIFLLNFPKLWLSIRMSYRYQKLRTLTNLLADNQLDPVPPLGLVQPLVGVQSHLTSKGYF
jgi:hypothetical protein